MGKKFAAAISKGLQGAAQGYQTGQTLQNQRMQAETQKAYAEAQTKEIAIKQQQQATAVESANRKQYYTTLGNVVRAPEAERKNVAKILLPEINKYAAGGHMTPFVNEDDVVTHSAVSDWSKSIIDINEAKAAMPAIFAGQKTPEFANATFEKARASLQTQRQFAIGNEEDLASLKKDSADLENVYQKYVEKYGQRAEGAKVVAQVGGQPLTKDQFDITKAAGGLDATGKVDPKTGVVELAPKPKEMSRQAETNMRQARSAAVGQFNKIRSDPTLKKLEEQDIGLQTVDNIMGTIDNGNTVAAAALGVKMAKAMGEVGALSEGDVTRYVSTKKLSQRAGNALSLWLKGTPSEATLDDLKEITGVLRSQYGVKIQPIYNKYVNNFSKTYKIDPAEAADLLSVPMGAGETKAAPSAAPIDGFDLSGFK